jgi:hypothetical protein
MGDDRSAPMSFTTGEVGTSRTSMHILEIAEADHGRHRLRYVGVALSRPHGGRLWLARPDAVVERAKASGDLRPEFTGTDAIFIQIALHGVMDRTRGTEPELYRRYLTMFLDGVRADGPRSALPVAPLSVEQTHTVMTSAAIARRVDTA